MRTNAPAKMLRNSTPKKDGERPAVLVEKERSIRDEELQLPHEIEGDGE